jgi:uncharacterized YigZ family protein
MDHGDTYKTIAKRSAGSYKSKGSKFLAVAIPLDSEDEVKEKLKEGRTEFHDARHHCFAYMVGFRREMYRFNDDGEPSGTAGRPILGQINSNDLTNILVVVVRYFGGVKLGVRGLITAYKTAAADALASAKIITKTIEESVELNFEYPLMNQIMRIIKDEDLTIVFQRFELSCQMVIKARISRVDQVVNRFSEISKLDIKRLRNPEN